MPAFFLQIQENGEGFFPLKDRRGNCDKLPLVHQKGTAFSFLEKKILSRFFDIFVKTAMFVMCITFIYFRTFYSERKDKRDKRKGVNSVGKWEIVF